MKGINKLILLGNVGRDPETRHTRDGKPVTNFSVATSRSYLDKSGQRQEETEWHKVVCFGRLAEIAGQYLEKGHPVYLEGRLQTRQWTDKDGLTRSTTEVIVDTMQLLGKGESREQVQPREADGPGWQGMMLTGMSRFEES